jgi:hypothetical protein
MKNLYDVILQDPVLLVSAVVILVTVVILIWAMKALKSAPISVQTKIETQGNKEDKVFSDENPEVVGARLHEISNQLCELTQKISDVEKNNEKFLQADRTMKLDPSQLQALPAETASSLSNTLVRLEAKLDGILKLLVNLTDSNSGGR